ncbi:MAG: hypothetical protein R2838_27000 [Caldilineaceae bacterium]
MPTRSSWRSICAAVAGDPGLSWPVRRREPLYLGHHFPSDVFAGAVMGAAYAAAYGWFCADADPVRRLRWLLCPDGTGRW